LGRRAAKQRLLENIEIRAEVNCSCQIGQLPQPFGADGFRIRMAAGARVNDPKLTLSIHKDVTLEKSCAIRAMGS